MKQYTDKDQTIKLIELGFPKPARIVAIGRFPPKGTLARYASYKDDFDSVSCYEGYSIGELIEFLPKRVGDAQIDFFAAVGKWFVRYEDRHELPPITIKQWHSRELINSLFDACVTLKEEGVI